MRSLKIVTVIWCTFSANVSSRNNNNSRNLRIPLTRSKDHQLNQTIADNFQADIVSKSFISS